MPRESFDTLQGGGVATWSMIVAGLQEQVCEAIMILEGITNGDAAAAAANLPRLARALRSARTRVPWASMVEETDVDALLSRHVRTCLAGQGGSTAEIPMAN